MNRLYRLGFTVFFVMIIWGNLFIYPGISQQI